jgi:hypothetical protein
MIPDRVEDQEYLFRVVKPISIGQDGRPKTSAFNDRFKRPSVDRAHLIDNDPTKTALYQPGDSVLQLIASEIRGLAPLEELDKKGRRVLDEGVHKADVEPVTEGHHEAHAEIFLTRHPDNGIETSSGVFARFQVQLAAIARFSEIIKP